MDAKADHGLKTEKEKKRQEKIQKRRKKFLDVVLRELNNVKEDMEQIYDSI